MASFAVDVVLKARDEATPVVKQLVGLTKQLADRRKLLTKYTLTATKATKALAIATVRNTAALEAALPGMGKLIAETNGLATSTRRLGAARGTLLRDTRRLTSETAKLNQTTRRTPAPRPGMPGGGPPRPRPRRGNDPWDFRQHRIADALAGGAMTVQRLTSSARQAMATPIRLAADFEQAMTEVKAVTTDALIGTHFDQLSTKARELGASTEFTAEQVAYGLKYMGVAGYSTRQQLAGISPLLDAATVSGLELGKASDLVTDVMGGFGIAADDMIDGVSGMRYVIDSMTATTLNANTNLDALARGMFKVGPLAQKAGVEFNEISALLGVLANSGIKGAEGGTALRNILLSVTGKPSKDMRALLKAMGLDAKKLRETLDKDGPGGGLVGALTELMVQTEKLSPSMQLFAANTLFGRRTAVSAVNILGKLNTEYAELKQKVDDSRGASDAAAATFRSTAKAAGKSLTSALSDLGIEIGDKLMPMLLPLVKDARELATAFGNWAENNGPLVRTLGHVLIRLIILGTVLAPVLLTLSAITSVLTFARTAMLLFGGASAAAGAGATAAGAGAAAGAVGVRTFGMALKSALGPIGLVLIGLEAIAATIGYVRGEIAKLNDSSVDMANGITDAVSEEGFADAVDSEVQAYLDKVNADAERFKKDADKIDSERGWFEDMLHGGRNQSRELEKANRERADKLQAILDRRRAAATQGPALQPGMSDVPLGPTLPPGMSSSQQLEAEARMAELDRQRQELLVRVQDDRVAIEHVAGDNLSVEQGFYPGGM